MSVVLDGWKYECIIYKYIFWSDHHYIILRHSFFGDDGSGGRQVEAKHMVDSEIGRTIVAIRIYSETNAHTIWKSVLSC